MVSSAYYNVTIVHVHELWDACSLLAHYPTWVLVLTITLLYQNTFCDVKPDTIWNLLNILLCLLCLLWPRFRIMANRLHTQTIKYVRQESLGLHHWFLIKYVWRHIIHIIFYTSCCLLKRFVAKQYKAYCEKCDNVNLFRKI